MAISQTVAQIWRFFHFQDGGRLHLGFLDFRNFNGRNGQTAKLRHCAKFRGDWLNFCGDMAIFRFFQDGGGRHLEFLKFEIFSGQTPQAGLTASRCQTSWRFLDL